MDILRIEWNGSKGFMEIYPDKFFPCTINQIKKLFKLIDQWCSDEVHSELDVYLHQEKEKAYAQMVSDVNAYSNARQQVSDLQTIIAEGKHPNGVKLTNAERKEFKEKLKDAKITKCTLYNFSKNLKTKVEKYERNIELLHTHTHTNKRK